MLDYERPDAYQVALDLFSEAIVLSTEVPRGWGPIADQLRRAALSVPLNIAEGVGRHDFADRRRCFTIARGSAMECGALFDVYQRLPGTKSWRTDRPKELARRTVAVLTKMGAAPLPKR